MTLQRFNNFSYESGWGFARGTMPPLIRVGTHIGFSLALIGMPTPDELEDTTTRTTVCQTLASELGEMISHLSVFYTVNPFEGQEARELFQQFNDDIGALYQNWVNTENSRQYTSSATQLASAMNDLKEDLEILAYNAATIAALMENNLFGRDNAYPGSAI